MGICFNFKKEEGEDGDEGEEGEKGEERGGGRQAARANEVI